MDENWGKLRFCSCHHESSCWSIACPCITGFVIRALPLLTILGQCKYGLEFFGCKQQLIQRKWLEDYEVAQKVWENWRQNGWGLENETEGTDSQYAWGAGWMEKRTVICPCIVLLKIPISERQNHLRWTETCGIPICLYIMVVSSYSEQNWRVINRTEKNDTGVKKQNKKNPKKMHPKLRLRKVNTTCIMSHSISGEAARIPTQFFKSHYFSVCHTTSLVRLWTRITCIKFCLLVSVIVCNTSEKGSWGMCGWERKSLGSLATVPIALS